MTLAAPFPYFGGKRRAAPIIWAALGDPAGYVEPFAGSAAVLLARPTFSGRRVETINESQPAVKPSERKEPSHDRPEQRR